jgi:small subunit ribosomal protein S7
MPRNTYKKQPVKKDDIYNSFEVAKLINYLMIDGKKTVARKIVYQVFEKIKKEGKDPIVVLEDAIHNVAPNHEVKPRRLGGASYLVPIEVRQERKLFLALNWIIETAKAKSSKEFHTYVDKLYSELIEASTNQGAAVAKKAQTEKLAEANKAFSHLKW